MAELAGTKVLVIEDSRPTLRTIAAYLEQLGCEVIPAQTGLEAVFQMWRHRPGCVLLDNQLPIVGGLALYRELRRAPEFKDVPVVICSGSLTKDTVVGYLSAGRPNFLVKPFDLAQITEALQSAIDGRTGEANGSNVTLGDCGIGELIERT
jgi:two-component system phosphate regulon response regulator PhoB